MKIIVGLCVIGLILCFSLEADAAVYIEKADCEPGKAWTEPGCIRKQCASNGKQISGATCGVIGCPPGIGMKAGDESKPYPECCPTCDL